MGLTFFGITSARSRFGRLTAGLREAASGEVLARAVDKVRAQVEAVATKKLSAHVASGAAVSDTRVDARGAMVQIHEMPPRNAKAQQSLSYLSLKGWWPFRGGMPPFVVKRAALIFARELVNVLGVKADRSEAADLVSEADATEVAKVEKRSRAMVRPRRGRG